jgi:predicted ArsR family transcriptional regulator
MDRGLADAATSLGALAEKLRRCLYLFIRRHGRPVGRDEAAAAVGMSRKLAPFHLDKLVDKGLLKAHYARLPGRSGPGAGRSSKLYEPLEAQIAVTIPARRYDLVGQILVDAMERAAPEESPRDAARRVAWATSFELGQQFRSERRLRPPGPERTLAIAEELLSRYGFEPYREERGRLALRNCPFDRPAQKGARAGVWPQPGVQ